MVAGGWHALGAQTYPGELSVATDDGVYRFVNGVFRGRARAQEAARSFDLPKTMRGLRLVGFLFDEGGMWSLSPRWRAGALAAVVGLSMAVFLYVNDSCLKLWFANFMF